MPVPDFQSLTLPVLKAFADGQEHPTKEIRERVAAALGLSAEELAESLPRGGQTRYINRIAWAYVYMKQAGLLASPRRGIYQITARGQEVLKAPPPKISMQFLERFPEYREFRARQHTDSAPAKPGSTSSEAGEASSLTPDEQIRAGYQSFRANLAAQILERVRLASPKFFENLVIDLLVAMGYGGSHADAAKAVGRSGDGGIDGIIKEDRLGLENIYVQAKRWESTVGRPTIQQFAEIPSSPRNSLPLMAQIPEGVRVGADILVIPRSDHTIAYPPVPEDGRYAWRGPCVDAHDGEYRKAGAILAARAFDVMRHESLRNGLAESPYPRLRVLLEALEGTTGVERDDGRYCFRDDLTGTEHLLADVP